MLLNISFTRSFPRKKAFNQKEDSLEEYKNKYLETHTLKEWNKHFLKLIIKPAKRKYTFHKNKLKNPFKLVIKLNMKRKIKLKAILKNKSLLLKD